MNLSIFRRNWIWLHFNMYLCFVIAKWCLTSRMDIVFFLNLIHFDRTNNLDPYVFTDTVVLPYILLITIFTLSQWTGWRHFYRPQRSWAKVIFSQACVCPQGGGCLPQCMLGYTPRSRHPPEQTPPEETPPPRADTPGADPPRARSRPPPGADTPRADPPEETPPREQTPPLEKTPPPGKQTAAYG